MNKDKTNAAMQVESNVIIKTLDSNNKVIRENKIHNKATLTMVSGLLEFLNGAFTPVSTNNNINTTIIESARKYIPVSIHLGNVGVEMSKRSTKKPIFTGINSYEFKIPTFNDYQLQQDITPYYTKATGNVIKFDTASITSFDDSNNSMGLLLQAKLPAGRLLGVGRGVNRKYFTDYYPEYDEPTSQDVIIPGSKGWVYYDTFDQAYKAMFTEVGLVSDTGLLLARVLLDGKVLITDEGEIEFENDKATNNPLIQSDSTSLVIEWRIGLISLGPNDEIVSSSKTLPEVSPPDNYIDGQLDTLVVPDGISNIRDYCFYGLENLTEATLPHSLQSIGNSAFEGCISLTEVYYKGTEQEWSALLNFIGEDNDPLLDAHINYIVTDEEE